MSASRRKHSAAAHSEAAHIEAATVGTFIPPGSPPGSPPRDPFALPAAPRSGVPVSTLAHALHDRQSFLRRFVLAVALERPKLMAVAAQQPKRSSEADR